MQAIPAVDDKGYFYWIIGEFNLNTFVLLNAYFPDSQVLNVVEIQFSQDYNYLYVSEIANGGLYWLEIFDTSRKNSYAKKKVVLNATINDIYPSSDGTYIIALGSVVNAVNDTTNYVYKIDN